MNNTIPKKALVAVSDFKNPNSERFSILPPEEAFVSVFDRSFHFGDSVYEVFRTYNGVPFGLEEHLQRLKRSAALACFKTFPSTDFLLNMIKATCKAFFQKFGNTSEHFQVEPPERGQSEGSNAERPNAGKATKSDVYVRVTVSRGFGDLNIDTDYASDPYPLVFVKELTARPPNEVMKYAVVTRHRNLVSALDPALKSGNYLNNILALEEAKAQGAQDAIFLNYQGFVTEGTTNNIFIVKNGEVWSAPLSIGILAGITREFIIKACKKEKIPFQDRLFTPQELFLADEVFMSSSIKELLPVVEVSGRKIGLGKAGPITKKLQKNLRKLIEDYCVRNKEMSLYV